MREKAAATNYAVAHQGSGLLRVLVGGHGGYIWENRRPVTAIGDRQRRPFLKTTDKPVGYDDVSEKERT